MPQAVSSNLDSSNGFRPSTHKGEYTLRWVLAHEPPVVFDAAAKLFEDQVRDGSSGDIDVQLFRAGEYSVNSTSGPASRDELVASLQRGEIEMAHCYTSALGAVHDKLWAIELPFLFRDYAHADAVWEGQAAQLLMQGLPKVGLRGVAFAYSGGFRIVATADRELRSLADFEGLRLRTAGNPVPEALYELLGGSAKGASLEAITGLRRDGKIDGCEITCVRYQAQGLQEVFPTINVTGHSMFTTMTVMNDSWFQSLPDRHQATIMDAGKAACRLEREVAIEAEKTTLQDFETRGMSVITMDSSEHAEFSTRAKQLHAQFAPRFGDDVLEAIRGA